MLDYWKTIYETYSPINGEIKVVESGTVRKLLTKGYTQSKTLNKQGLAEGYWDAFNQIQSSRFKVQNTLILGLGAGTIAQIWKKRYPNIKIVGVEIDPIVVGIAKKYFDFPDDLNVIIGDACQLVKSRDKELFSQKYDFVAVDVYYGGDFDQACESDEFLSNLSSALSLEGKVAFNRIFTDIEQENQSRFIDLVKKYFREVEPVSLKAVSSSHNVIIFGTKK